MALAGHCLCGASRFELEGPHNWVGHCHCESCRRATASPIATWIGHPNGRWKWTGATPKTFGSSPGNERGFCETCGTPLYYYLSRYPDETHFYAALLQRPTDVVPAAHYHRSEQIAWLHLKDDLPNG